MTITESEVDVDVDVDGFIYDTEEQIAHRTTSYQNVFSGGNTVVKRSLRHRTGSQDDNQSITTTETEKSEDSNDSNDSDKSNATTASEKKVKIYARKLESIFTVIFLVSFIIYTIIMFAFIPM